MHSFCALRRGGTRCRREPKMERAKDSRIPVHNFGSHDEQCPERGVQELKRRLALSPSRSTDRPSNRPSNRRGDLTPGSVLRLVDWRFLRWLGQRFWDD